MPRAWRICKTKHAAREPDGEGARLHGGRWTSAGIRAVYASESLSLAVLEVLAHLQSIDLLAYYSTFDFELPDELMEVLDSARLPRNWRDHPAPASLQTIGDEWIRAAERAVLKVPSAIIVHEHNFVINPRLPEFERIKFGKARPLDVDPRILRSVRAGG